MAMQQQMHLQEERLTKMAYQMITEAGAQGQYIGASKELIKSWLKDLIKLYNNNCQGTRVDGSEIFPSNETWFQSKYPNCTEEWQKVFQVQLYEDMKAAGAAFVHRGGKPIQHGGFGAGGPKPEKVLEEIGNPICPGGLISTNDEGAALAQVDGWFHTLVTGFYTDGKTPIWNIYTERLGNIGHSGGKNKKRGNNNKKSKRNNKKQSKR